MKPESGQALIIIVMVLVLSLATGLAVATRSSSTVHQTTNLAASEQALATAESAIEEILASNIGSDDGANANNVGNNLGFVETSKNGTNKCKSGDFPGGLCYKKYNADASNWASVSVSRTPIIGNTQPFSFKIDKDDVQQVWLMDPSTSVPFNNLSNTLLAPISVCWVTAGDPGSLGSGTDPAAIEITTITGSTGGPYSMNKQAFDPLSSRKVLNNFNGIVGGSQPLGTVTYTHCATLQVNIGQALRIRSYYANTTVGVMPTGATTIPFQANVITATGYSGDSKRTVQVTKTLPQLPGIFDYAIFSGGSLINQ
ncbi:MAG: hypothetical protein NT141_00455 [candidate division WWE3 bacterium]|nr:hypothetical protein [candidate division WWE3 bacterium]